MKILIIEDAKAMRIFYQKLLKKLNFTIIGEGSDGVEGVSLYKELQPDLVILDINLPRINGLQCLKKIMKFDKHANVIVCSAMGYDSFKEETYKLGVKHFFVKPFEVKEFTKILKNMAMNLNV